MRKDLLTAIFVGFLTALIWIPVLGNLGGYFRGGLWALLIIVPVAYVVGLYICGILFNQIKPLYLFMKYVIVGFLSAGIDFAIFNVFIYLTGVEKGLEIVLFKAVSFFFAMLNSYNWNKIWTFEFAGRRFFQFAVVTIIGFLVNVGLTSLIINFIPPMFGFTQLAWDNLASAAAIIVNVILNFTGYKIIVFKSNKL